MGNKKNLYRIKSFVRRVAVLAALIVVVAPPAIVGYVGYLQSTSELDFRAQVIGDNLAEFINIQGPTWEYNFHRMPEFIALGDPDGVYFTHICKHSGGRDELVYEEGPSLGPFKLTSHRSVFVRGIEVGGVTLSTSAQKHVYLVFGVTFCSVLLGIGLFMVFDRMPMRILTNTIVELEASRMSLANEVAQKNSEAQRAEEANLVKSNFLAHMSHEMRTPLNAIIGFSDMMTCEVFGPLNEKYEDYAKDITNSGKHLLQLVNSVLDLSKVEQNKVELNYSDVSLRNIINETTRLVREESRAKQISVSTLIDSDLPDIINSDYAKLYQMLINIVANAIKYTPAGGRITVSARPKAKGVKIAVEDTGIGMTTPEIQRALEPFGQIRNAFTTNTSGTGLGLTIVSSFAEMLGGWIKISSVPDKGTKVILWLPLSANTQHANENIESSPEGNEHRVI